MRKYLIVILCFSFMLASNIVWAHEGGEEDIFSEDDIFSEEESVVPIEEKTDDSILEIVTGESTTFSGEISANFGYDVTRKCLEGDQDCGDNPYSTSVESDLLLDVRLTKGIKSFADLWVSYSPQENEFDPDDEHLQTTLKEFFVDANIARKIYFRFGKQNLKWGRGYLWNPTDLISEDRKDFSDIDARREGIYGLKMHVPFGTTWNIYGFINASGANRTDEFAVAGKLEVLLPNDIEMSVSAWKKKDYVAVYGLDFATHKFNMDLRGEMSLSHGDNRHRLEIKDGEYLDTEVTDEWVPRLCVGFTKYFDFKDVNDRISVTGEFYYNHGGYEHDMLEDEVTRDRFLEGDYFESNNYGKYYAALFSSYSKFILSDMTLNLNALGNLSDSSFMMSSGVTYGFVNNVWLNFDINAYLGAENREYTLHGNAIGTDISINLTF
jgi:hypothetical protein